MAGNIGDLRCDMTYKSASTEQLVKACAETRDPEAWREFVVRFHPLIARLAVRIGAQYEIEVSGAYDDLAQEAYLKLCEDNCRILRRFDPRCPDAFYAYLKVVAGNAIRDRCKALAAARRGYGKRHDKPVEELHIALPAPDPAGNIDRTRMLNKIEKILKRCCGERDRTVFWLYYRQGLTSRAIASIPALGLSAKGVESVIHRLTRLVREELDGDSPE